MLVKVENENFGYSVATHKDWVIVGNPSSFRYDQSTSSVWRTGSLDIFKYNPTSDNHDLVATLYSPITLSDNIVLAKDSGSADEIHTDIVRSRWIPVIKTSEESNIEWYQWILEDLQIEIDLLGYAKTYESDYGHSLDLYNDVLVVGNRWKNSEINISERNFYSTGSSVDVYNLSLLNVIPPDFYMKTGSSFLIQSISPPNGEPVTGSFGSSVSVNDEWIAVGSPNWNNTLGAVHLYRRNNINDPNDLNFSFFQTITGSSNSAGDYFGYALDINKATGSYSRSLVVGCGNKTLPSSKVYYFEFNGTHWKENYTFQSDRNIYPLPFFDVNPILRCDDYSIDGFGNSVALWGDDLAIGAPTDRWFFEYSGSRAYKQGTCYLYRKCSDSTKGWYLVKKFYGTDETLKNNKLGFSVDLWDDKCVISCPKSNVESMNSCYIEGSVWQQNYCYEKLENYINGQWVLLNKNTSSAEIDWDVVNVYQKKKRYLSPYRSYGFDVAVADKSIVVGSPMIISDVNRDINILNTASFIANKKLELDDLSGKSYIYNLKNFREQFHVGNVFYRNGKIVLNTSGSVFQGLWFNPINEWSYEYEVQFNNKQTLYEKQIVCTVEPGEFNVSTNPTAVTWDQSTFDLNQNGKFDWQDLDIILKYMQWLNTQYNVTGPSSDWTSSILKEPDEISYYNFQSSQNVYYNTESDFVSQSFFKILQNIDYGEFDFNNDSKVDTNDINIFWKYYSNRLTQTNYQSYITPNSKRKLLSDILDHLDSKTQRNAVPKIKQEFLTYDSQSYSDKTGSYLTPYVTSIGLYDGLDLVAVAKLGSPIRLTKEFPINFVVKLDF